MCITGPMTVNQILAEHLRIPGSTTTIRPVFLVVPVVHGFFTFSLGELAVSVFCQSKSLLSERNAQLCRQPPLDKALHQICYNFVAHHQTYAARFLFLMDLARRARSPPRTASWP